MDRLNVNSVEGYRISDTFCLRSGGVERCGRIIAIDHARPALVVVWQNPTLWAQLQATGRSLWAALVTFWHGRRTW